MRNVFHRVCFIKPSTSLAIHHYWLARSLWKLVANSRALTEQRLRKYQPKTNVKVYYNPHKPKESLIEREIDSTTYSLLAIASILLLLGLVFGLFIIFNELKDCGITLNSTHPRSGAKLWCYR
ncbi:hypothetical protein BV378_26410 [Nostoc sp. RF31YmG]|nr:hypothetical protein BV378_26410 [Nostoc sp. RF31YmG]